MIFVVQQLAEKAIEHNSQPYLVFVNLHKAYDSVPCMALWIALWKLGVHSDLITLIRSFHQDMKARLRVDGNLLEEIEVANDLRQGCTMAPTLLNLYACVIAQRWLDRVKTIEGVGTLVVNKQDGQLFRR